jgi:hypothetical protein
MMIAEEGFCGLWRIINDDERQDGPSCADLMINH